jgi:16S rRNA (cytosine967-C5)-methyltransferase
VSTSQARLAAFRILSRLHPDGGNLPDLLHSEISKPLSRKDRSLSTELVYGVLRRQLQLDWILSHYCSMDLKKLDLPVLLALRLGAYQILFLSRIPIRAAVHESVEYVKGSRIKSATGMVNAVLRKLDRESLDRALGSIDKQSDSGLALHYSHPAWLVSRWRKRFGDEESRRLMEINNLAPSAFFRMNSSRDEQEIFKEIAGQGVETEPHPFVQGCWMVLKGDLLETEVYHSGRIHVQDPASQLIPQLLSVEACQSCLDVCAAPGGKLSQLARMSGGESLVVGMDLRWQRLRLAAQLHHQHWGNIRFVVADGRVPLPFSIRFDRVLVDAPCSGTGTLQRNPDIRWRLSASDLEGLQTVQSTILENAARQLKPGGVLAYSTCSLEEEENEAVVSSFLESHPEFASILPSDSRLHRFFNSQGFFQLLPSEWNNDGFFAALLIRLGPR